MDDLARHDSRPGAHRLWISGRFRWFASDRDVFAAIGRTVHRTGLDVGVDRDDGECVCDTLGRPVTRTLH